MTSGTYRIYPARFETIEDAVAFLCTKSPEFAEHGGAEIRIGPIRYPDFVTRHGIILVGPLDHEGKGCSVGMASAEEFTAKHAIRPDLRHTMTIDRLDHAIVDELANVTLADDEETRLFDVRLNPSAMPQNLTASEEQALRLALEHFGISNLDYSILPSLGPRLPPLKQLPDFNKRREHYRAAFLKTGMRQPRYGKHAD